MADDQLISLSPAAARFVQKQIARGRFGSAREAVEAGIEMLRIREQEEQARLEHWRKLIQEGVDDIDAGRVNDGETVMRELREKHERLAAAQQQKRSA